MANIDNLKREVDNIKNSLNELKNNVSLSEREKKSKAEELKTQAETTKQKIQNEIRSLETKTDEESKKKKDEAETLLNSFNEIMNLYNSIINPGTTETATSQNLPAVPDAPKEDKGATGKSGGWIREQWEKIKENPGKYILGATGLAAAGFGIKKAWDRVSGKDKKGKDEDKDKDKEKDKKDKDKDKDNDDKETSWRRKFLVGAGITTGTVFGGVEIFKNWNRITSWVKEKLGLAQNFEEAMYSVETEVRNGINNDNNFGEFSAHFNGISYDESTQEISSFGQKTKINKSNKTIDGEPMNKVQFASWEELFHAVNIVNFAKRELKGRGGNETPFTVNKRTGDIDFTLSDKGKTQFIGANGSNFWTKVLGLGGAGGGGLLGGYFLGLKGGLSGAVAGGLTGYTLGSVIDNTSTMGRACETIAKGANLQKFTDYLNKQNIRGEQEEVYEKDDTTPFHKYFNEVKREINDSYDEGNDNLRRDLKLEWDENNPEICKIQSYYQEIAIRLEGCTVKKGEKIDFSKITKIHIEKYDTISDKKIDSRGDGLDINFPSTEKGLKEAIKTANLTNKIVNDWRGQGGERYPFFWGKYTTPPSLDMDTDGFRGKTILSRDAAKNFPTLFEDLKNGSNGGVSSTIGFGFEKKHQTKMHNQALNDEKTGSQYIKFLHQIGKGNFWKK